METGMFPHFKDAKVNHEFWSRVKVEGDCWVWQGALRDGVPYFRLKEKADGRRAVRMLWELCRGPLNNRHALVPKCGEALCVNPAHFELPRVGECPACGGAASITSVGLCRPCYDSPSVRDRYQVGGLRCRAETDDFEGFAPMPDEPTDLEPGTTEKILLMQQRVKDGVQLHHPMDHGRFRGRVRGRVEHPFRATRRYGAEREDASYNGDRIAHED